MERERFVTNPWTAVGTIIGGLALLLALLAFWQSQRDDPQRATPSASTPSDPVGRTERPGHPAVSTTPSNSPPSTPAEVLPRPPEVAQVYDTGSWETRDLRTGVSLNRVLPVASLDIRQHGLSTYGGGLVSPLPDKAQPRLAACTSIPAANWTAEIAPAELKSGARFCVVTEEDRYGYFIVRDRRVTKGGNLVELSITYVIWKSAHEA